MRQDPCGISRKIRERLNDYVPVNKRKRLKSMEIEIEEERLEAEIKVNLVKIQYSDTVNFQELETKITVLNGLTSTTTESIRLKFNQETQFKREQRLQANIVFAAQI